MDEGQKMTEPCEKCATTGCSMFVRLLALDNDYNCFKEVRVKEIEYNLLDMSGKVINTNWKIVENHNVMIPEVFEKPTGRYRYRDIRFIDNENEARVY